MEHIDREGSYSVKVDALAKYFGSGNLIPLWVADMDFKTPDCVREALEEVLEKGFSPFINLPKGNGRELAAICHEHNIIVISDEIHADMPLFGTEHIPFASVSKEAADISITFGAPSKTFNMAGIVSSFAVVPNPGLREPFYKWMQVNELSSPTIFATLGAIAAYTKGGEWRMKMLDYIEGNVVFVEDYCKHRLQGLITPVRPLSSFLIWLDCRELSKKLFGCIDQSRLVHLFVRKAGLALNDGAAFGPGGEGYMRLNVGCGKETLEEAMDKLKEAIDEY